MNISNLDKQFIRERKYADANSHKIPQNSYLAYEKGWEDAIKFAKRVDRAIAICTQCGKLIEHDNDYCLDYDGAEFCSKCYKEVFGSNHKK